MNKIKNGGFPPLKYCSENTIKQSNDKSNKERLYIKPISNKNINPISLLNSNKSFLINQNEEQFDIKEEL